MTYQWILMLLALPQVVYSDPCDSTIYQIIDDRHRSTQYVVKDPTYEDMICDRTTQGWFKFEHGEMPTTCQQPYHCGTHIPLWLNGTLPPKDNKEHAMTACGEMPTTCQQPYHCGTHIPLWLNGTLPPKDNKEHAMTACGNSNGQCCRVHFPVTVKNCGQHCVYNLVPTKGCSIAYCAGSKVPCPPDQWSSTGFQPGCKQTYPKMTQSPKLSNPILEPNTFKFNCDINFDPSRTDVGFQVEWLFDGKTDSKVPKEQLTANQRTASMDQKYLEGHLGETVSCRVKTYFKTSPNRMSPGIESNGYWCGIKISEARITVGENEKPRTMKLISTIPIVCDKLNQASCKLEVYLDPNDHDITQTTSCTQVLRPTDWNPTTHTAETTFQVLAERDGKKDGDKNLELHFQKVFTFDAPTLFNNYSIPYLQIRTKDKDTSSCRCWGDPHCSTFDSQLLQHNQVDVMNYYKIGEFQMFKSTSSQFEVQVRTWSCGHVSCICAVAAREGNDVFVVDLCHGSYGHTFPHASIPNKSQLSQGTVVQQNSKGDGWIVYFPTGNYVKINANNRYLTVEVKATEADWGHTQGLCGTFDGRIDNDFTHINGAVTRYPNKVPDKFVESWRVPLGTSLFDKGFTPDPKFNHDLYFCNCDQKKKLVDCRINGQTPAPAIQKKNLVDCRINGQSPAAAIQNHYHVLAQGHKPTPGRRRQVAADDADYVLPHYRFDYGLLWTPVLSGFPTKSGRTQADALKLCNDAFNADPTIRSCRNIVGMQFASVIENCVEDIKYTDETSFINGAIDAAIMSCSEVVLKDLAYYNNATGLPPAFITTDVCLSQCSGHGTCVHGSCRCDRGFTGFACEIDHLKPPQIGGILSTNRQPGSDICDLSKKPCKTVYMVGDNFAYARNAKCKVEELWYNGRGFVSTGRYHQTNIKYQNQYSVGCILPAKTGVIGYSITLTNDGHLYSNSTNVYITDSKCLNCRSNGGHCTFKSNTCLIDGVCRINGEANPSNPQQVCEASISKTRWTDKTTTTQTTRKTTAANHVAHAQTTKSPVTSRPVAPMGGVPLVRFDIWTLEQTGCACSSLNKGDNCACCDVGAVQCPSPNQHQCVQTGKLANCGTPLPSPDYGIDGYTVALSDCDCTFNNDYDCACCQNGGCPCGPAHKNQCVDCKHMDHCGNKPWIFGPAYPTSPKS